VGPVFSRVWNTADSRYAEKFKHTIEPFVTAVRTSNINNFTSIVQIDSTDRAFGATQFQYGLTNRLYAKRRVGQTSQSQEIVNVEIRQTYYTDALASLLDPNYASSQAAAASTKFSPIATSVRIMPTNTINATLSAEIDSRTHDLRTLSMTGSYNWTNRVQTSLGWSRTSIAARPEFNIYENRNQAINVSTNARTRDNRFGGLYSMNYDVLRSTMLQQRISAFYNAQCCGIALEFQRYNFAGLPSYVVPADHRFFLSFTLAGLGNFSPFNGALGGVPH
jgi:hypothetical protein